MVPPSVADTATKTEPKSRLSRTIRMPAKFKDFVLNFERQCTLKIVYVLDK